MTRTSLDSPVHLWRNVQSLADMGDAKDRPAARSDQFEKGGSGVRPNEAMCGDGSHDTHKQQVNDGFNESRTHAPSVSRLAACR
jgi:hypothetical protein